VAVITIESRREDQYMQVRVTIQGVLKARHEADGAAPCLPVN